MEKRGPDEIQYPDNPKRGPSEKGGRERIRALLAGSLVLGISQGVDAGAKPGDKDPVRALLMSKDPAIQGNIKYTFREVEPPGRIDHPGVMQRADMHVIPGKPQYSSDIGFDGNYASMTIDDAVEIPQDTGTGLRNGMEVSVPGPPVNPGELAVVWNRPGPASWEDPERLEEDTDFSTEPVDGEKRIEQFRAAPKIPVLAGMRAPERIVTANQPFTVWLDVHGPTRPQGGNSFKARITTDPQVGSPFDVVLKANPNGTFEPITVMAAGGTGPMEVKAERLVNGNPTGETVSLMFAVGTDSPNSEVSDELVRSITQEILDKENGGPSQSQIKYTLPGRESGDNEGAFWRGAPANQKRKDDL